MKPAPMPESIRVGYRTYSVELWPEEAATDAGCYGDCNHIKHRIRIGEGPPRERASTLLHEVMHAVWTFGCLGQLEDEEHAVSVQSHLLYAVLVDNPDFAAFLANPA